MSAEKGFVRNFKTHFVYAGLFSFFVNLALLVPPLYMIQVFDRVLVSRSNETLVMLSVGALMVLAVMMALDYLRALLLLGAGGLLDRLLGERIIYRLIENGSRMQPLEQMHGLKDIAVLRTFFTGNSIVALFDAPWMLFFLILIFLFHPLLGIIALGGALSLFLLAYLSEKMHRSPLEEIQIGSRKSARFIDLGLRNADVLNAMAMNEGFVDKWKKLNSPVIDSMLGTGRQMALIHSVSKLLRPTLQITMLGAGAYLVLDQSVTPGVMIATTIILGRAIAPVESLIANWNTLVQARGSHARIRSLLETVERAENRIVLPAPTGHLSLEKVALAGRTPDRPIIRHVSCAIEPGESVAVVGPSASGKSSLARLIVGIWTPTSGSVRMDNADVSRVERRQLGAYLGYMPQDVELFPATVGENIARLGPLDSAAIVAAAQRARVHDMILRLPEGYDTRIGEGGVILSGGQMQRIGLARALYGSPRLVVLDEPNANLDSEGESNLHGIIADLKRDGVTLVVITHKPSLLGYIDKVLVMREGVMEAFGPRAEVLPRITGEQHIQLARNPALATGK